MKVLHLNLIKKWFELTKNRIKTEDYRNTNPETEFWEKRLLQCYQDIKNGNSRYECKKATCKSCLDAGGGRFKSFDIVNERNGMKKGDKGINYEFKGITYGFGRSDWGAKEGEKYFIIKLGNIIEKLNK